MIRDIAKTFQGLKIDENRALRDDYAEMVFLNKDMGAWDAKLAESLGPVVKPIDVKPTAADSAVTASFGGIQAGQALYRKDIADGTVIAMLWPWRDNEHTTLKLALVKGAAAPASAPPSAATAASSGVPAAPRKPLSLMVKVIAGGIAVLVLLAIAGIVGFNVLTAQMARKLKQTVVEHVDLAQVADGAYEGSYVVGPVSARVSVQIASGTIRTITVLKHDHGPGYGGDAIVPRMVAAQSVMVDGISGATASCIVMRKAVELALRSGLTPPSAQ